MYIPNTSQYNHEIRLHRSRIACFFGVAALNPENTTYDTYIHTYVSQPHQVLPARETLLIPFPHILVDIVESTLLAVRALVSRWKLCRQWKPNRLFHVWCADGRLC